MRFKQYGLVLSTTAVMALTSCATQQPVHYQPVTTADITLAQTAINYAPNYAYVTTMPHDQKTLSTKEGNNNEAESYDPSSHR